MSLRPAFGFRLVISEIITISHKSRFLTLDFLDALTTALDPRLRRLLLYKNYSTMSDLAPFVASVLYDKVLAEIKQENDSLLQQLQKSRAVQIISENGTVYAEAQLEDGSYRGNPNLWLVNFTKQLASCKLSDLTNVKICIGGICKAHFGANSIVEGIIERDEESTYVDGWGYINFCFGGTGECWLSVKVGPFPSEEAFSRVRDIDAEDMASFLAQNLGLFSVTFEHTAFFVSAVKGAIQNLNLDPEIEEEAQMRREQLDEHIQLVEQEEFDGLLEQGVRWQAEGEGEAVAAAENGIDNIGTAVEGDVDGGREQ